jgi:hypothetical protein
MQREFNAIGLTHGPSMRALIFGATGMAGQGVLRECLLDPGPRRIASLTT